ncbi:MAG: hypothetical protein M1820_009442 [Bogoriella megaspora]|nr:MAG: hypothetical protein M1820_009442 [Bogoriella megaspora]
MHSFHGLLFFLLAPILTSAVAVGAHKGPEIKMHKVELIPLSKFPKAAAEAADDSPGKAVERRSGGMQPPPPPTISCSFDGNGPMFNGHPGPMNEVSGGENKGLKQCRTTKKPGKWLKVSRAGFKVRTWRKKACDRTAGAMLDEWAPKTSETSNSDEGGWIFVGDFSSYMNME